MQPARYSRKTEKDMVEPDLEYPDSEITIWNTVGEVETFYHEGKKVSVDVSTGTITQP